jgi:hypothetical protein
LAARAIDLSLLAAERQEVQGGSAAHPAAPLEVDRELRFARESLARGEARRALQHLRYAATVCPPACARERRRIELFAGFVESKRHL